MTKFCFGNTTVQVRNDEDFTKGLYRIFCHHSEPLLVSSLLMQEFHACSSGTSDLTSYLAK